ncbi:ATP-binding cassette domain-containing protein [Shewanella sp. 5_MG-2023]|uniref:peptidase domain-containing ABC transporter n=1 Tax=Shewanella sp. 5_MG-2023 TaxID=3062656 RepID=UPI0026E19100|nr:ATP-binding cassette domain-containing protein [Shewanella sp. 5_MG-2023]MDO6638533.1 ATP-binding cassette domain-containing protein [Shewanella sp. 5_MG-2023]
MKTLELKPLLVELLQQLGLYTQASNVASDTENDLNTLAVSRLLKKHQIGFSVIKPSDSTLHLTIYPFLVVPAKDNAFIARRQGHQFEKLENNHWQTVDMTQLTDDAYLFVIDALPRSKKSVQAFAAHMSKRTKWYRPVFWLSLLSSITGLAVPLFTMAVYDRVIGGQTPSILPSIALGGALAVGVLVSTRLARAQILATTSNRFARDLSQITFYRLLHMPLMVLSRVGISNHIARMRNAEKVRMLLSGPGGGGLVDLPFTIIALLAIMFLSGWLVLVPIGMLMLYYLVMKVVSRYVQAASPTISGEYQNTLSELAKNLLQLKAAGDTEGWQTKFIRQCRENSRQNFLYAKRNGLNAAIAHSLSLFTALITVFTGIFLVLNQTISSGALIACVMMIWRITGPAQLAFSSQQKFTMMDVAVKQFDRFMQATTEQSELRLDTPDNTQAPAISFQHLTLRYKAEGEPALSGVNVDIEPGELVAVIGPNACGKSTLLLSALGVLEAQAGFVTVNGKNLKQYDTEIFRHWVAYSPSQPDIFPGTLAENIRIAKPDATDDEIKTAIIAAGGASFFNSINNDLSVDLLGENNAMLSAIEGSYINLARALIKQSPLLLLDEPLPHRNPESKQQLIKTLLNLKGQSTVMFTSHDQDLIKHADKVIILDKGAVVYAGPIPDQAPQTPDATNTVMQESPTNG